MSSSWWKFEFVFFRTLSPGHGVLGNLKPQKILRVLVGYVVMTAPSHEVGPGFGYYPRPGKGDVRERLGDGSIPKLVYGVH